MEADNTKQRTITVNTALGPMSLVLTLEGLKLRISPGMKYAEFMEYGTRGQRQRPFLQSAIETMKDNGR